MIPVDSKINDSCYTCKKKQPSLEKRLVNWYYLSMFTDYDIVYQYFCPECWKDIAGEEFMFEEEQKEIPLAK